MKIGLAAPEKPSHLYLENDPSPLLDLHYLRISPWLWFSSSYVWNRRCYCEGGELFSMVPSFQVALR